MPDSPSHNSDLRGLLHSVVSRVRSCTGVLLGSTLLLALVALVVHRHLSAGNAGLLVRQGDQLLDLLQGFLPLQAATDPVVTQSAEGQPGSSPEGFEFGFNAFGDAGWADSHVARPVPRQGFKRAYLRFDPHRRLISDLNYINWETSVGRYCAQFWSPAKTTTYAFLTPPEELNDAIQLGFNLIGLANNHSYDCVRSPEGAGPLQTVSHLVPLASTAAAAGRPLVFSGVHGPGLPAVQPTLLRLNGGDLPLLFVSAYVGGDPHHCRHILCLDSLTSQRQSWRRQPGLRVLALHSWDPGSHARLRQALRSYLSQGYVDIAIGTGPHIGETVERVRTPRGEGVLVTSLGNFIHPGLSTQRRNLVLRTRWRYQPESNQLNLLRLNPQQVSCAGGMCRLGSAYPVSGH